MTRPGPPPALTPLIGHQRDLASLIQLETSAARLCTLTGPAGIGKTRLAIEVCRRWSTGPVVWVDMSSVTSRSELVGVVANRLGMRISWADPGGYEEALGYAIEARGPLLLVLDQAESALDAIRRAVPEWLQMAPLTRVLVTSQERVGTAGEWLMEVGPLSVVADEHGPSAAVQLVKRHAGNDLPNDPTEHAALERLVAALDGVPLALELVAARLRLLAPSELLARFTERGLQAIEGRGRLTTVTAALTEAWQRLNESEQRALARCGVFTGAFGTNAAEAILGPGALDLLQVLRDGSLLARHQRRHRLYSTIRSFARQRLSELGLVDEARRAHADYYSEFCSVHGAQLGGTTEAAAFQALTEDLDEIRSAWRFANATQRRGMALALAKVLVERGPAVDALPYLDAVPPDAALRMARAKVNEVCGRIDEAIAELVVALEELDCPRLKTICLVRISACRLAQGSVAESGKDAERAIELSSASAARDTSRVDALRQRALVFHASGQLDDARARYEEGLELASELELSQRAAQLRCDLGSVLLQERRLDEARAYYESAVRDLDPETSPVVLALAEGNLAILEQELGHLERASELQTRGIARLRTVGHRLFVCHLAAYAGSVEHERGELTAALAIYDEALIGLRRVGDSRLTALVAALRGAAEAEMGRVVAAVRSFELATASLQRIEDPGVHRAVELHRLHLVLSQPPEDSRAEVVAQLQGASEDPLIKHSDDARIALRLLDRRLDRGALSVFVSSRRVTLPNGEDVDLSKRGAIWRMLLALAKAHEEARHLDSIELIEVGWPDETTSAESGLNRVKVALSTLRKLGFREILSRNQNGYALDPSVPVNLVEDAAEMP